MTSHFFRPGAMALIFTAILHTGNAHAQTAGNILTYEDAAHKARPVQTKAQWETKRRQILDRMQLAMGPLPARDLNTPMQVIINDSLTERNHTRYNITFMAAPGEPVSALLFVPLKKGKHAAILALHGTSALGKRSVTSENKGKTNRAYAEELADRGYVVIAPDYPSFGDMKDYDFEHDRYESGTMKAIFNHMRCIDLLQTMENVDSARIGVIGHSLGGHNAMFAGAFDRRIKVIVASCGWTKFSYYNIGEEASKRYGGRLGPWAQTRYMPLLRDKYKLEQERMPFDFDEVIATLAPRPFYTNSPVNDANFDVKGVKEGMANVAPVYSFFGVPQHLQVSYPDAAHDFPPAQRLEAYRLLDGELHHTPEEHTLLP
ncbi:alpha/beta hydrolase [Chitinophaga sp. GCM10012297]|uniref:Alpha/beta hydrolase n=1 Tax=Chitinophaga chungangae TaxID=2821488 RepID=A0ABS3Y818_9BACT|nr:alpha/beta fold hydrolase [Chitinophaga chungangae]MBO9150776.1 alpha/beta hydrolase [Chitinophaga chungangae]